MKLSEALMAARGVIASPDKLAQGAYARLANGSDARANDPDACQWCAMGAVYRALLDIDSLKKKELRALCEQELGKTAREQGWNGIVDVNDHGGHSALMAVFTDTINRIVLWEAANPGATYPSTKNTGPTVAPSNFWNTLTSDLSAVARDVLAISSSGGAIQYSGSVRPQVVAPLQGHRHGGIAALQSAQSIAESAAQSTDTTHE